MRKAMLVALAIALLGVSDGDAPGRYSGEAPGCERRVFEGSAFEVCAYHPRTDALRLVLTDGRGERLGRLGALERALGPMAGRVRFAMNAGMYEQDGTPVGLHVENGVERRPVTLATGSGNFFLLPNGVFATDAAGRPSIRESNAFAADPGGARFATQSGPLLVSGGAFHPAIAADGDSRWLRNGVGVRGGEALFVISDDPVSFGRLARFVRDALGCSDALYFDGTVSSLWDPGAGRQDDIYDLGPMVVVSRR